MNVPIIHRDIIQHSPEWYAIRAGKWTASHAATIMGGLNTLGLESLIRDIAWQRVFGPTAGDYQSPAMQRGNEMEPVALAWYADERGSQIESVGFVTHGEMPNVGWSPDALCGSAGAIEIKCPLHKAWMDVKRTMAVPSEYRWQTRWAMWVGHLRWLDFVVFHPQAGGLIIPCELLPGEAEQMAERIDTLEPQVAEWVEIIRCDLKPMPKDLLQLAIDDPGASF